ncbi:MAG TPA: hypothetical protein VFU39_07985, partial [Sulfuricaulis sp.]|nr:hypothetical protein [Sulfuricaulis sp.]
MVTSRKPAPPRAQRAAGKIKKLLNRWRGKNRLLSDTLWSKTIRSSIYARALPRKDQQRLRQLTEKLLSAKSFEGASGFTVSAAI